mmetsp:Transcript_247/g.563  ORF Transcript_247/g.563 Transcript_247/m.563 type:complete len:233 (+) Transcript_247:1165-1863(+)
MRYCFFTLLRTSSMYQEHPSTRSARTTPLRTFAASFLKSDAVGGTIPGQSNKYNLRVRAMYCQILVSPGTGAALQTFFLFRVLITDDLPTLGYPIMPTVTCFLSLRRVLNCRSKFSKAFLPNGFVIEAWKASVGKSFIKIWIQRLETQVGTRSTLFSTSTMCLWDLCLRISLSRAMQRVPMGSRASRMKQITSEASTTLYSSAQIRREVPLLKISSRPCFSSTKPSVVPSRG